MASLMNDAPLTKAEQEEEEMRDELKDVGLYYENMGIEEMRQLINVLNESKNDVRKHNDDTTDSMLFNESISSQDTSKITENNTRPLPSFSYRQETASGTLTTQNSTLEESKSSNDKNSQASSSNSFEKNYRDISPDSEPIYDKNSNFKKDEDYPPLGNTNRYKTRSTAGDGPKTRSQDSKKLSIPAAKRVSMERWMLDPLEFIKEKNTTPLCQPQHSESSYEEPLSFSSEAIDLDSEEFDKLCQQMTEKLGTYNKWCLMELEAKDKRSAPIKINLEEPSTKSKVPVKENSSSIKNQGPSTSASPSARNTYDRATKRKALSTIAVATTYDNDENSSDECSNTKKRKFQQGKKEEEGVKRNQENKRNKNNGKSTEVISLDDKDIEFDNSNLHNIRKSSNAKVSTDNESNEQQSEYPRRIEPPNPAKKNFKGPRAKKKNSNFILTQTQSEPEKKPMFLNDEEIRKTIQEIDDQIEDNDCVEITDDIKPPPTPKRITKRLQLATNHLENARQLEEQKFKAEEEEKEQREREERFKLDERISSRLQEQENEEGRRLDYQRKFAEQGAFYNNFLNNKSKVTKATVQAKKTQEEINEDLLLEGDDDEPTITDIIKKQLCPICQKPYPADQIETHASGCDAYAADSNESYNRPSTSRHVTQIYTCHLCDKFETDDGNIYEEHVTDCKTRHSRQSMNGGWL